jgi:hypothetical protein
MNENQNVEWKIVWRDDCLKWLCGFAVAEAIGKSLRTVERASTRLVKEGRLRYVGPRKGGHWDVIGGLD